MLYEVNISVLLKPDKDIPRKGNYESISHKHHHKNSKQVSAN